MRPDRRAATALVVGGLLVATLAGAAVYLNLPRIRLSEAPSEADAVTLYQNGLAFVSLSRTFATEGGDAVLVFAVPSTTVFPSLTVEGAGVTVRELRSALAASPLVQPGDQVAVHIGAQSYRGTVVGAEGGQLVLETASGTTLVQAARADAIEIQGRPVRETGPGSAEVSVLVAAGRGSHQVNLTYLARGPGWTPSYRMDVETRQLAFDAVLTGLEDWANVTLDLVSGSPNVVASLTPPSARAVPPSTPFAAGASADLGESSGVGAGVPLGELHRYRLERPASFQRGETVRLQVLAGEVEVARRFHSIEASTGFGSIAGTRQDVQVHERAMLRNTLSEPLPAGVVRFYRQGAWIGEDVLPSTARGDHANVTLARSEEVKARLVLERFQGTPQRDTATYALLAENFKAAGPPIDLRASITYPAFRTNLLSAEPTPTETVGTTLSWDRPLAPGASATFRLSYETLRTP